MLIVGPPGITDDQQRAIYFRMEFRSSELPPERTLAFQIAGTQLEVAGTFVFTLPGLQLQTDGALVDPQRIDELIRLVHSHPEWTEKQIDETLDNHRAKFAPRNPHNVTASIPTKLEAALGKITNISAVFRYWQEEEPRTEPPLLFWSVTFDATRSGRTTTYIASMDPITGKLRTLGYHSK